MKKKLTGLLSIILAVSFIFTLAGCGNNEDETTAAATTAAGDTTAAGETTAVDETTVDGEATTAAGETTTAASETTTVAGETTTAAGETTTAKPASTKPTTVSEIVTYYNAAANKVKKDKPGYTLVTTNIIGKITSSNGLIQSLAKSVVPMFSTEPETKTAAKGDNGRFPINGQTYGSKLVASSLKSATCVEKGSNYEITLNFKDEKLDTLAPDPTKTRHGSAMNVLSKGEVDEQTAKFKAIVKIEKFAPTYKDCYIKCTIQKSTGNMLNATFYCVSDADIVAKTLFTLDAKVHFGVKEEYTLKY